MPTTIPNVRQLKREWVLMDATDQVLGRLATRIAGVLRGKHKPVYTPFLDTGDFVVVTNVEKLRVNGTNKPTQKLYHRYSGYPGGHTTRTLAQMLASHPDRVLRQAVKGMMPDGPLARRMLTKLKIYAGASHPHAAQQPALLPSTRSTSKDSSRFEAQGSGPLPQAPSPQPQADTGGGHG